MINSIKHKEYITRYRAWKKANDNNDAFSSYLGQPAPDPRDFGITTESEMWCLNAHLKQERMEPE